MHKFVKYFAFLLISAFLASCAGSSGSAPTPTMVPTPIVAQKPTYTVERGDVSKVLELRGRVVPVKQQELFFGAEGYVQEIIFNRGDTVQAGDLIAILDEPEDYEINLAAAELALTQAQVDLENLKLDLPVKIAETQVELLEKKGKLVEAQAVADRLYRPRVSDPLRIEQAEATLSSATVALDRAQTIYDKRIKLPDNDPLRISALNDLLNAQNAYYAAISNLNYLQSSASATEINQAAADLALAQAEYDRVLTKLETLQQEGGPTDILLAEAKVIEAQAEVDKIKRLKENVELRAPFDGQIMSLGIVVGDQVSPRKAVATLADPSDLEISVIPTPEELADLGVGQTVTIRLTSQQGAEIPGNIRILPEFNTSGSSVQKDTSARIVTEEDGVPLALNEAVTVIVEVETRPDVLWLPPAALRSFQGRDFVLVVEDGVQRRLDVLLGLKSAARIEVVSGLEEGQVVIGP